MKERAAAIKKARERLTGDFGRDPTVSELSEALGLSPEEIAAAETATSATESIQRQTGEEGFSSRMSCVQTAWRKSCSNAWPCRRRLPA